MAINNSTFNPDWASPPGNTLEDFILEQGKSIADFAETMQCKISLLKNIIKGVELIDFNLAEQLELATGAPKKFWLERESQYRDALETIRAKETREKEWLSELPTADMANFGWIKKITNKQEKLLECFQFFNVSSVHEWENRYQGILAETAFRTSPTFSSTNESVTSWLRQGEIKANEIECRLWNKEVLIETIPAIRSLSNIPSPEEFIPKLESLLAMCGVAIVIVRAPKGCHASGATYWINDHKAIVILSCKYLSDDHFWFTLFHELGHLILHSDHSLILESKDTENSDIEKEANNFSELVLIPKEYNLELSQLNSRDLRKILRFSKKIGVSKGIVVGQMQYKEIIPKSHLNKLKTRYSW